MTLRTSLGRSGPPCQHFSFLIPTLISRAREVELVRKPKAAKRIGRPPKAASERKGNALAFRARPALRAALDRAASASGRSLSEEVEWRLERSVDRERRRGVYDDEPIIDTLISILQMAEGRTGGGRWDDNLTANAIVATAIREYVRGRAPRADAGEQSQAAVARALRAKEEAEKIVEEIFGRAGSP
jgi:hypothetical protein